MKEKLLSCGAFAKICGVEKHVLFHYDEINLFKPVYVDEKGYRYYSYHQYDTFKVITTLKKLGMSLKDIRNYLSQRNPTIFLDLLEQQEAKIEKNIYHLYQIKDMISSLKQFTQEGIQLEKSQITITPLKPRYILRSNFLEDVNEKDFAAFMNEYTEFLETNHIASGEFAGIVMSLENIKKKRMYNYSYLFVYAKNKSHQTVIREGGDYLCAYHKGSYRNLLTTYEKMLDYAQIHHLTLEKYAYEDYLIGEISEKDDNQYITRISIKIKQK